MKKLLVYTITVLYNVHFPRCPLKVTYLLRYVGNQTKYESVIVLGRKPNARGLETFLTLIYIIFTDENCWYRQNTFKKEKSNFGLISATPESNRNCLSNLRLFNYGSKILIENNCFCIFVHAQLSTYTVSRSFYEFKMCLCYYIFVDNHLKSWIRLTTESS